MKISFCMILYNEAKLIRQQLFNLYPHAHEIIIVVGRVLEFGDKFPKEKDNTVDIIKDFSDPDKKITLIIGKDGIWSGKDQMVAAYYKAATGDYVWHVDADEFYSDKCIKNTIEYIGKTNQDNYAHEEYFYYRYYNVIVTKGGTKKFWNWPARIHKKYSNRQLRHRPQLLAGCKEEDVHFIPKNLGVRHHYSMMSLESVRIKAQFYGIEQYAAYFSTYSQPIYKLIESQICIRPDNNGRKDSIPYVLKKYELEVPSGIDRIFNFYEHEKYPWTMKQRGKIIIIVPNSSYDVEVVQVGDLIPKDVDFSVQATSDMVIVRGSVKDAVGRHGYGPFEENPANPII